LSALTSLSWLTRRIDNPAVTICGERPLTALTPLVRLAENKPAEREH
jgi:hypothetical protein